jgi:hypothetical protein
MIVFILIVLYVNEISTSMGICETKEQKGFVVGAKEAL